MSSNENRKEFEKVKEDVTKAVTGLSKIPKFDIDEKLSTPILKKIESPEISKLSNQIRKLTEAVRDLTEEITTLRHAIDDPSRKI